MLGFSIRPCGCFAAIGKHGRDALRCSAIFSGQVQENTQRIEIGDPEFNGGQNQPGDRPPGVQGDEPEAMGEGAHAVLGPPEREQRRGRGG